VDNLSGHSGRGIQPYWSAPPHVAGIYLAGGIDRDRDAGDAGDAAAGFDFGDAGRMEAVLVLSPPWPARPPVAVAVLARSLHTRRGEPRPGSAAVRRRRCFSLSRCNLWVLCVPCD